MDEVISADGTPIAYEAVGDGPTVILVGGPFCDHNATAALGAALAPDFTAVSYDRRGRGESGDTPPYEVRREIDDIEALIERFGGRTFLHGISSGGALSLLATAAGLPVDAVSVLEPPYRVHPDAPPPPVGYTGTLVELCAAGRRGDAVAYFMTEAVGQPPEAVEQARKMPMWPALEAMAHTLAYDAHVMGGDPAPCRRRCWPGWPCRCSDCTAPPARRGSPRVPRRSRRPCPPAGAPASRAASTRSRRRSSHRCSGSSTHGPAEVAV
jgi:pimeloyl-ACP methyl ester carboxylesterase